MTHRIIAVLLAISLAACTSAPRFPPTHPSGPGDTTASSSAGAEDGTAPDPGPEQRSADSVPEIQDTTQPPRSHLTEIGRGLLLVGLIALMAWLNYLMVCPYSYC